MRLLKAERMKAAGTWTRGQGYTVNDLVQYDGSLWMCTETHSAGASFSHECFRLQVKRGRDGRG